MDTSSTPDVRRRPRQTENQRLAIERFRKVLGGFKGGRRSPKFLKYLNIVSDLILRSKKKNPIRWLDRTAITLEW